MNKIAREQADLYQDLFNFLSQEHNLTCTIEEMDEIIHEAQTFVKKFDIANFSETKPMDDDYPLIPMKDIEDEARLISIRWHENATNWIGDKHKLASDIMNYARRKLSANAR